VVTNFATGILAVAQSPLVLFLGGIGALVLIVEAFLFGYRAACRRVNAAVDAEMLLTCHFCGAPGLPPCCEDGDDAAEVSGDTETAEQCDESCHERGEDSCSKCDTGRWELMCDSCRSYAAQDADRGDTEAGDPT
jgi:hypothetical protein